MTRVTLRLESEHVEVLDERGDNRSEAAREILDEYPKLADRVDELQDEVDRLRREKRQILDERSEKKELARYVEDEREREREREEAPVWTRARWWLVGRDRH